MLGFFYVRFSLSDSDGLYTLNFPSEGTWCPMMDWHPIQGVAHHTPSVPRIDSGYTTTQWACFYCGIYDWPLGPNFSKVNPMKRRWRHPDLTLCTVFQDVPDFSRHYYWVCYCIYRSSAGMSASPPSSSLGIYVYVLILRKLWFDFLIFLEFKFHMLTNVSPETSCLHGSNWDSWAHQLGKLLICFS